MLNILTGSDIVTFNPENEKDIKLVRDYFI